MLEKGQKVFMVKKRHVFEFIVEMFNDTHAIIRDAETDEVDQLFKNSHYQKIPIKKLYLTLEDAKASRFEKFKKGDLVACVDGWSPIKNGVVIDVNKYYVKVLINTRVRTISKANVLNLTEV